MLENQQKCSRDAQFHKATKMN